MKAGKRVLTIVSSIAIACLCCFTGCDSLYDVAPKEYGEWDGNYIYAGNVRCKTTGEDDEYLIESLMKDGEKYTVVETTDYQYVGDDIYLCLSVQEQETQASNSCFVCYDLKEKTTDIIYWAEGDLQARQIYKLSETFVVLQMTDYYNNRRLFKIDYSGNVLSENENYLEALMQTGEYLVGFDNEKKAFFYREWEETEYAYMPALTQDLQSTMAEYVEKDGRQGFLLQTMTEDRWRGLYFYELEGGRWYDLLRLPKGKELIVKNGYAAEGMPMDVTYTMKYSLRGSNGGILSFPKEEMVTLKHFMYQNCCFYQIDYNEMQLKRIYDFSQKYAKKDFTDFTVLSDGQIYFNAHEVVFASGCRGQGDKVKYSGYLLDTQTGKLAKDSKDVYGDWLKEQKEKEKLENAPSYENYAYYLTTDRYGLYGTPTVYTLYRYDCETGKNIAMQFWQEWDGEENYEVETDEGVVILRYSYKLKTFLEREGNKDVLKDAILVRNY